MTAVFILTITICTDKNLYLHGNISLCTHLPHRGVH